MRAADTASPWARRGGLAGEVELAAKVLDGHAVPLTLTLGEQEACVTEDEVPREVPDEIDIHRRLWVRFYRRWKALHYGMGIVATSFAITAAAQPAFLKSVPYLMDAIAWIAAVCVALITFLMPSRRARSYVSAARVLTDACNRYRLDPNFKMKHLLDALKEGEDLISRGEDP